MEDGDIGSCTRHACHGGLYDRDFLCYFCSFTVLALVDFADLDGNLLISNDRFKGVEVVKGKITLNDLPGIGVMKI